MTDDEPVDRTLLAALAELDAVCDQRSIVADVGESVVPAADPGAARQGGGELAIAITLSPMVGTATPQTLRAPYNDRTAEWIRALAGRVLVARRWEPGEWARQAVADVLGTEDAPPQEVAATAELPPSDPDV